MSRAAVDQLADEINGRNINDGKEVINNNDRNVYMAVPPSSAVAVGVPASVSFPANAGGETTDLSSLEPDQQKLFLCICSQCQPEGGYFCCEVWDPCCCRWVCTEFYATQSNLSAVVNGVTTTVPVVVTAPNNWAKLA